MLTRKGARGVVDIELAFSPKNALPRGQLPTKSDVMERALNETNWRIRETALDVAQEVIDLWMHCTVYPLTKKVVADKTMALVKEQSKLRKYPKRKKGETYFDNVKNFVTESQQLFDIFVHDKARRTELVI